MVAENSKNLESNLDSARKEVKTEAYPMSIGEVSSLYISGDIILNPEYQRYFRWDLEQKTKLIESILIGLPLPSFFVSQDHSGKWEVVDGMQRLSTILDFMGVLSGDNTKQDNYKKFNELSSAGLFYLQDGFANKKWEDFTDRIKLDFKRSRIDLTILMRETSDDAKFELFQRLNSGGTSLSSQELRNAILSGSKDSKILKWLNELADYNNFKRAVLLPEKDIASRYDIELVLRFMVLLSENVKSEVKKFSGVSIFITHVMRLFMKAEGQNEYDFDENERIFKKTFDAICSAFGKDGALKYKNKLGEGKFSIGCFEVIAMGIAQNIDNLPSTEIIKSKLESLPSQDEFRNNSGSGIAAKSRIPNLLDFGRDYFKSDQ